MPDSINKNYKRASNTIKDITALSCLFLSGFFALVYEICWIKKSALLFGTTTLAMSTVVAVFFGGLALGSYLFGKYSQTIKYPIKLYGILEIGVGIIALFLPVLFHLIEKPYALLYPVILGNFLLLSTVRFILITLLILPPTMLMGGSLPLFCRYYVNKETKILQSVGFLYALNTIGATIGCMACGFYFLPHIGINKSILFSGIGNIFIGSIVVLLKRVQKPITINPESKQKQLNKPIDQVNITDYIIISLLFFLSGFAALGNEILWTRFLSLIIHNTVYTYTITLSVILCGIVMGSILISLFGDRIKKRALLFGITHLLIGISIVTLLLQPARTWQQVIDTQDISTQILICMIILLVPAVLSGISFPLAIRMVVHQPSLAGIGVGRMTAVNIVGGILGSLSVGFFILPLLGLQRGLLVTTGVSMGIGFCALLLLEQTVRVSTKITIVLLGLLVWAGIPFLTGTHLPQDFLAEKENLIDFKEGIGSQLAVIKKKGDLFLEIDRLWQGQKKKCRQIVAAHVPMLLHENPEEVCVIGVGVGQTPSRFLLYNIKKLDCIEIEKKLIPLVKKHFDSEWMDDPRVHFIIEDGRNYILHTNKTYDIISLEVGQTFRPNLASFYTVDFYQQLKKTLKDNGLVSQFIPMATFSSDNFCSAVKSFITVFPYSVLWYNGSEFLLIGSTIKQPKLTMERLDLLYADSAINADLRFSYWGGPRHWLNNPYIFLSGFLSGPAALARMSGQFPVYRDDLPILEYISAKNQTNPPYLDLFINNLDSPEQIFCRQLPDTIVTFINLMRRYNINDIIAQELVRHYHRLFKSELLTEAYTLNPESFRVNFLLGVAAKTHGNIDLAIKYLINTILIKPDHAQAHNNLGTLFHQLGKYNKASYHFSEALRINPSYAIAHNNLGTIFATQGNLIAAIQHFQEALRIDPDYKNARYNLEMTMKEYEELKPK